MSSNPPQQASNIEYRNTNTIWYTYKKNKHVHSLYKHPITLWLHLLWQGDRQQAWTPPSPLFTCFQTFLLIMFLCISCVSKLKKIVWSFSSRSKFSSGRRWQSNDWGAPWHILSRFWLTTRALPLAGHSRGLFGHYPLIWPQAEPPCLFCPPLVKKVCIFDGHKVLGRR